MRGSIDAGSSSETLRMPTLAEAREKKLVAEREGWFGTKNLLDEEPHAERLELALVVRALVHTRKHHDRDDELGTTLVARLVAAASQMPARRLRGSSWQCVVAVHDRAPRKCNACTFRLGKQPCEACAGGQILRGMDDNGQRPCSACRGVGLITCARCDGDVAIQRVTVRTFVDHVAELEHVFLPHMPIAMTAALSQHLLGQDELPAALRVELERPSTATLGSYRGNAALSAPRFHGIEATSVLPDAKSTLARLASQGALVERVVEAHAVPIALLSYGGWTVGLVRLGESLHAFPFENDR